MNMATQHLALKDGTVACGNKLPGRFSTDHLDSVTCKACRDSLIDALELAVALMQEQDAT